MSLNLDATRLGRGTALDAHVQHTVAVAGRHRIGIDVVGQADDPAEAPLEAFVDMAGGLFVACRAAALAGQGEHAALEVHIDGGRVHPRGEGVDLHGGRRAAHVQRRVAAPSQTADGRRGVDARLELALQALQIGEEVAGEEALQVNFNEDSTIELTITGINLSASNLGADISTATNNWGTIGDVGADIDEYSSALGQLRTAASTLGSQNTLLQTRLDFTKTLIDTLKEGSDKLVSADMNEEGANLLALQTRQQLGVNSLSLAAQSEQAILSLFQ